MFLHHKYQSRTLPAWIINRVSAYLDHDWLDHDW